MVRVRCAACGARHVLARAPGAYQLMPACPSRGCAAKTRRQRQRQDWYVIGPVRRRKRVQVTCRCACVYYFPHRRGGGWCLHNPNWTAEDAAEAFGGASIDYVWVDDPLSFGQRPTQSEEPPF